LDSNRGFVRPYVEEANASEPFYSHIFKEMILIAQRGKPMTRSGKGSIQRMAALRSYEEEIDRLSVSSFWASQHPLKRCYN